MFGFNEERVRCLFRTPTGLRVCQEEYRCPHRSKYFGPNSNDNRLPGLPPGRPSGAVSGPTFFRDCARRPVSTPASLWRSQGDGSASVSKLRQTRSGVEPLDLGLCNGWSCQINRCDMRRRPSPRTRPVASTECWSHFRNNANLESSRARPWIVKCSGGCLYEAQGRGTSFMYFGI